MKGFRPGTFRLGEVVTFVWGDGQRDKCALLCGEPIAASIYDGTKPDEQSYTVRVTQVSLPGGMRSPPEKD